MKRVDHNPVTKILLELPFDTFDFLPGLLFYLRITLYITLYLFDVFRSFARIREIISREILKKFIIKNIEKYN